MTPLPMVGRGEEIDAIGQAWARVAADPGQGPGIVVITGEAGTGKSRLVAEALDVLRPVPAILLAGTARAWAPAPYDWLASALSNPTVPAGTPFPFEPRSPSGTPAPGALLRVAQDTVRSVLGSGPGVLVVEDLHDLDPESLTLIADLARALALPALLIVTSRSPDEGAFPGIAARVLGRLTGTPRSVRRHLGPLTAAEVAMLVEANFDAVPPPDVVRAAWERTDGNPFWLTELLSAYRDSGLDALARAPLPGHLAALVLDRLTGEEPLTGRVARTLALLGDRVGGADLDAICEVDVEPAIRRLLDRGLLALGPGGEPQYRHALAREAMAGSALTGERADVYGRALALAAARGDDDATARYAHALGLDQVSAAAALRAAHGHLAAGLPASALRAADIGLRSTADSLPLLRVGVAAASGAGQFSAAAEYAARWLELARRGVDILDLAAAHRELADQCWYVGRAAEHRTHLDAARERTRTAIDLGVAGAPAEWARYLAAHAQALQRAGRPAAARAAAEDALARARALGDPFVEASALVTLGLAMADTADIATGAATIRDAQRIAEASRDVVSLGRAVNSLLSVRLPQLSERPAWRLFDEAVATLTRYGLEHGLGRTTTAGVDLAIRVGDLTRARDLVHARLPIETDPLERVVQAATAGLLAVEAGDRALAQRMYELADADAAAMDQPAAVLRTGLLAVAIADSPGAAAHALAVHFAGVPAQPRHLAEAARWALRAGVPVTDLRVDADPESRAGAQLRCVLAAAGGDDEAAVLAGTAGLAGLADVAWHDADIEVTVARCLIRLGRADEATEYAERALALLRRWPGWRRDEVAGLLAAGPTGAELTPREQEVLGCVAAGMSNQRIATSLGISVRTVTVHVSNLLRKTGSASRTEAALWAVRHGLAA
jgi:DNA-binding CsgD family transcriptional regulator